MIQKWLWTQFERKGLKPRILTKADFCDVVRSDAAVGAWCNELEWEDAKTAVADPRFWELVDEERERHLNGTCKYCIFNTMGKKEVAQSGTCGSEADSLNSKPWDS